MNQPKYQDNTGSKAKKKRVRERLSQSALNMKNESENAAQKAIKTFREEMGM